MAVVTAGNDYKERLVLAAPRILAVLFLWAFHIGPLARFENGRVSVNVENVHRLVLAVFAVSQNFSDDKLLDLLKRSQTDMAGAHEQLQAAIVTKLVRRRKNEDGSLPDLAATDHLIGRIRTVVDYNSSVLHNEREFLPERWLTVNGWRLRAEDDGYVAANFAYWWGDNGSVPILGPIVPEARTALARNRATGQDGAAEARQQTVRARKIDYDVLVQLAARPQDLSDQELEAVVATFQPPLPLEQARRFIRNTRRTAARQAGSDGTDGKRQKVGGASG